MTANHRETLLVFPSSLGWFALCVAGKIVRGLAFGHRTADAAAAALGRREEKGDSPHLCEAGHRPKAGRGPFRQMAPRGYPVPFFRSPSGPAGWWQRSLADRLQAYAEGLPMDFRDVHLDLARLSPFQQTVLRCCREIPYGRTMTYGQLAAAAGSPRAARAVGNCMAGNPVPLLVPCHRVVPSGGACGSYSAPGGTRMKQRLLSLENQGSLGKRA